MEMPIPSIYVIEIDDGQYELIDGLQRISSYLSFRGFFNEISNGQECETFINKSVNYESDNEEIYEVFDDDCSSSLTNLSSFALNGCDIITELNGLKFDELQAALQIKLKRAYIRMEVLRKGINPELKYHMFKRLNTGGEKLSYQEIRNCTIRLINNKFINYIISLKSLPSFKNTIKKVSTLRIQKKFDEELVLRFFAFKNDTSNFKHDTDEFLTSYMEKVSMADDETYGNDFFDYEKEHAIFEKTFSFLDKACGDTVFSSTNKKSNKETVSFIGFNVYLFESITVGIQSHLDELCSNDKYLDIFKQKITELKSNKNFRNSTIGGGKNSSGYLKTRIDLVNKIVEDIINGI